MNILFIFVSVLLSSGGVLGEEKYKFNVYELLPGSVIPSDAELFRAKVKIYCHNGQPKYVMHLFHSIQMQIQIEGDDFVLYEGSTPDEVADEYENKRSIFSFNFFNTNRRKVFKLTPFNSTCIGIETASKYGVQLNLIRIDFWKVIFLIVGLLIFFTATRLSQNSLFYYLSGITLGIFASFLVIVYLGSKLIPKKPMMYGVMLGGWTLGIYFAQLLWENIQMILVTYQVYAFWYVVVTGFISFVICYRLGPPKNERSKNLIRWGLQLVALILIFFSSDFQEASAGIAILAILFFYFPKTWLSRWKMFWNRRFPPKPRLLTNEEFYEQGVRETTKALDELRSYCSSPECKQWTTMMKLKDPRRFASFMEGSSHLVDDEILEYEVSQNLADDDDVSEDEEIEVSRESLVDEEEDDDDEYYAVRSPEANSQTYTKFSTLSQPRNGAVLNSTPHSNPRLTRSRSRSQYNGASQQPSGRPLRNRYNFNPESVELSDDD